MKEMSEQTKITVEAVAGTLLLAIIGAVVLFLVG